MKKLIMVSLGLSLCAFGMSFKEFKRYAQKHAKVLQSQALNLQTAQEEAKILLRTQNPTLGFEASHFNPEGGDASLQYGASLTQSVRTPTYYRGLEQKADAMLMLQEAYNQDAKAGYLRAFEKLYTEYVYQSKLLTLLQEEYRLSQKVTQIVKTRYESGTESRVSYLQAKTSTTSLKTQIFRAKQEMQRLYYQLLERAGVREKIALQKAFIYPVSAVHLHTQDKHPKRDILQAKKRVLESQMQMNQSSIESYELYANIEDEPDQSILRIGIALPLPLFNDKSEERMLAKLQQEQLNLEKEQLEITLFSQKEMLKASIRELTAQYHTLLSLKQEQQQLKKLLHEGYKISQGSIFVMMNAQNKLIQTQKALLQTQKEINYQNIDLRFIQGDYND